MLAKPYRQASLERVSNEFRDFYGDQATALIVNRLLALVGVEAPILLREATLRVTQCWNSRAFSQKAHDRHLAIVKDLHRQQRLFLDDEDTLWSSRLQSEEWNAFRLPLPTGRAIDTVPMAERRAALLVITREALSMDGDALLREACLQLTGGTRFTQQQRSAIALALDQLLQQGLLGERDGRIYAPAAT